MKFTEHVEAARLRVAQMLRDRHERAMERKAERKAVRAVADRFHAGDFLVRFMLSIIICIGVVEWFWAVLFAIKTTGHLTLNTAWSIGNPLAIAADFSARWPTLIGRAAALAAIVGWSMIWLPMWFRGRGGGRWLRVTMAVGGVFCNGLVASQGFFVLNDNRQEQVRGGLVIEQSADQGRDSLRTQIHDIDTRLTGMRDQARVGVYAAIAANVGTAAYDAGYLSPDALARTDPARVELVRRARGAAVAADALEASRAGLQSQLDHAAPAAATAAHVEDSEGAGVNALGVNTEVYWPLFASISCTFIGIFGSWWLVWLYDRERQRAFMTDGIPQHAYMVEDQSDKPATYRRSAQDAANEVMMSGGSRADAAEAARAAVRAQPPRRKFTDSQTGEEIEQVRVRPKEHWRTLKSGSKVETELRPAGDRGPQNTTVSVDEETGVATEIEPGVPEGLDNGDEGARSWLAPAVNQYARNEDGKSQDLADDAADEQAAQNGDAKSIAATERTFEAEPVTLNAQPEPPSEEPDLSGLDAFAEPLAEQEPQAADDAPQAEADSDGEQDAVEGDEQAEPDEIDQDDPQERTPETRPERLLANAAAK